LQRNSPAGYFFAGSSLLPPLSNLLPFLPLPAKDFCFSSDKKINEFQKTRYLLRPAASSRLPQGCPRRFPGSRDALPLILLLRRSKILLPGKAGFPSHNQIGTEPLEGLHSGENPKKGRVMQ